MYLNEQKGIKMLREYQKEGIQFLVDNRRVIFADEMGLGKTIQVLKAVEELAYSRILIIGTKNSLFTWIKEINKWYPNKEIGDVTLVRGSPTERKHAWINFYNGIALCSYGSLTRDTDLISGKKWEIIICDEVHRPGIKNRKTVTFKALQAVMKQCKPASLFLISGTPSTRGVQDMWAYLKLLYPKSYSSYWAFMNKFCIVEHNGFGKEIVGQRNMDEFRLAVSNILLQRKKIDVTPELPPKIRSLEPIELDADQKRLYGALAEDLMMKLTDGSWLLASTKLAAQTRLRQILVCPRILDDGASTGAGLEWIIDHIIEHEITKAIIFCPFPSCFEHLEERIREAQIFPQIEQLRGGMEVEAIGRVIDTFKKPNHNVLILVSIKFAESYDLVEAQAGYFLGREYNPAENYQAEDRMHRMNSTHAANIYYPFFENTLDSEQFDILTNKLLDIRPIFDDPETLAKLFKRGL